MAGYAGVNTSAVRITSVTADAVTPNAVDVAFVVAITAPVGDAAPLAAIAALTTVNVTAFTAALNTQLASAAVQMVLTVAAFAAPTVTVTVAPQPPPSAAMSAAAGRAFARRARALGIAIGVCHLLGLIL